MAIKTSFEMSPYKLLFDLLVDRRKCLLQLNELDKYKTKLIKNPSFLGS